MNRFARLILCMLIPLSFVACGDDSDESAGDATASALKSGAGSQLLEYIPADTPYFFGALAPMDDDVLEAMRTMNQEILRGYGDVIKSVIANAKDEASEEGEEAIEAMGPLLAKFGEYFEDGQLDELGFAEGVTGGIYGVGLLPVMRLAVEDAAQFEKGIAELEASAGSAMSKATIDGLDYRYFKNEEAQVIVANDGDYAIVSVMPTEASDNVLKEVLGLQKPANTLAETSRVADLSAAHGLLPQGLGFIDTVQITETFLSEQSGVNAELLAIADYDASELSDVCKDEIRDMAKTMPAINAGYTRVATDRFDLLTVVRLREDLATGFKSLAAAVPGLGGTMEGLFAFGFSVDIPAARAFISERAAALEADPFECELFAELQNGVAEMQAAANQPLPPVADSLRGAKIVIDRMDEFDMTGGQPPSVDARALIAINDAPSLLLMGQMFMPQLASLELEPNGEVLELPQGIIPGMTDPTFVALTENAISLGVGADSKDRLAAMFDAPVASSQPLTSFSYDTAAYMRLMGSAMEQAGEKDDVDTQAMTDMFNSMQKYLDRTWFDVVVTDAGIEMPYVVTLKQP